MRVTKNEALNVRRVTARMPACEVAQVVCDRVADELGLDRVVAANHLVVKLADDYASVRGEIPLTREEQLEALGLTPTEPVETQGAAIAEELVNFDGLEVDRSEVSPHPPTGLYEVLPAVERYHNILVAKPQNDGKVDEAFLYKSRDEAVADEEMQRRRLSDTSTFKEEFAARLDTAPPLPRFYTLTPSADALSTEDMVDRATNLLKTLERLRAVVGDATGPEAEAKIREVVRKQMERVVADRKADDLDYTRLLSLKSTLESLKSGDRNEPITISEVEQGLSVVEGVLARHFSARPDLAVGDNPGVQLGSGEYTPDSVKLGGGGTDIDGVTVHSCQADKVRHRLAELREQNDGAQVWGAAVGARLEEIRELEAELRRLEEPVVPRPEPQDSVGRTRRRTLLKLADRLLQEVLLTDKTMSADTRCVVNDVEVELRRMSR